MPKHGPVSTLVLLRHGESIWNGQHARFTGWADVPLTVRGRVEAVQAGQLLRARGFHASRVDVAFASCLQRAHETCELALASMAGPEQNTWCTSRIRREARLNERHYGALQGDLKADPSLKERYGAEMLKRWRRSMDVAPPPLDADHEHWLPSPAPTSESLADCQRRALACFEDTIAPALFDARPDLPHPLPEEGSRAVFLVAHSNTIRALMASFDNVPSELIPNLHVPNSVPILYRFELETRRPVSTKLQSAAGGSHARWLLSPTNVSAVGAALQTGGLLTRALFDACDPHRAGELAVRDLDARLTELLYHADSTFDPAVANLARKIMREFRVDEARGGPGIITLRQFERRAAEAADGLWLNPEVCDEAFADSVPPGWRSVKQQYEQNLRGPWDLS